MAALDQARITTAGETQPIMVSSGDSQQCNNGEKKLKPQSRFRLPLISEKGAILMVVWNLFFAISLFSCQSFWKEVLVSVAVSFFAYPLVGWLVDSKLGKYKVIQASQYFLLASIILNNLSVLVFPNNTILAWSGVVGRILSILCYASCIIPFTLDQMIGASGEELSFTVYWMMWGFFVGWFIVNSLNSIGIASQTRLFILLLISSASFLITYVLLQCFSHHLNTKPQLTNPIKLIAQVLNYARKHKYPERRSALTYWEEDYPSRLDLGKEKYGGPFTFEQVEDVKTVLRLLPLLTTVSVSTTGMICLMQLSPDIIQINYLSPLFTAVVALPMYHFIVYPLFYNYIPTLLGRIGLGVSLACTCCIANALVQLAEISQGTNSNNVSCMFDPAFILPFKNLLIASIIPTFFSMLSLPMLAYFLMEFIIAQTPHHMIGLVNSIAIVVHFCTSIISVGTMEVFYFFPFNAYPNCGFYYYIIVFLVTTIAFCTYLYLARKYKLRVRDDIVPVHRLAEEYFEKEQKLRRAYWKEIGFEDSDESKSQSDDSVSMHEYSQQ